MVCKSKICYLKSKPTLLAVRAAAASSMQHFMFPPHHQDRTALSSKACSFSEVRDAGCAVLSTSPGQPLLLPFLPSNGPLLGIPQVPPLKMKEQNTARLWMPWEEDKTYQKGQQVDSPKAETEKLWGQRRGRVPSLFLAIDLSRLWLAPDNAAG